MYRSQLPSVSEMVAHLDLHVVGQRQAKLAIARAFYRHFLSLARRAGGTPDRFPYGRSTILLLGPTGSGKTHLVTLLANYLGLSLSLESAAGMVQAGYVGHTVDNVLRNLVLRSGNDPRRAERGVIFIDEVDKLRCAHGSDRDISGEGVQQSLLVPLDGQCSMSVRMSQEQVVDIDTSRILFIFAGAFAGLPTIVRERLHREQPSQFGSQAQHHELLSDDDALAQMTRGDLEAFGLIPELIGRIPIVTVLGTLTKRDLLQLLATASGGAVKKSQALFGAHGIRLTFSPGALEAIAEEAARFGTGARGLDSLIFRSIEAAEARLPELEDQGITEVRITRAVVCNSAEPILLVGDGDPTTPEQSSADLRVEAARLLRSDEKSLPRLASGISDTTGWNDKQLQQRFEQVRESIGWNETTGTARNWWKKFESENSSRMALVLRLAEELQVRKATITELFLSWIHSGSENIQANLHYLDYRRLREADSGRSNSAPPSKKRPG